jgi:hypothetical protein
VLIKISIYVAAWFMCANSFASTEAYQAVFHLTENGKKTGSASVIIPPAMEGVINSMTKVEGGSSYRLTIKSVSGNTLSADYRFKQIKGNKEVEIAETAVPFTLGKAETSKVVDSAGNSFEVSIVITKSK